MDQNLISLAREKLYSGVISDVLDSLDDWRHAMALGAVAFGVGIGLRRSPAV
jgi:hypothetical protein